jgi:hypothetical protein
MELAGNVIHVALLACRDAHAQLFCCRYVELLREWVADLLEEVRGNEKPRALIAVVERVALGYASKEHRGLIEGRRVRVFLRIALECGANNLLDEPRFADSAEPATEVADS